MRRRDLMKTAVLAAGLSPFRRFDQAETYYKLIDLGVRSFATDYPVEFLKAIEGLAS
ncbi:MAG: hypothetical protein Q4D98_02905 [Planctomycetia bacterium]|nr:hypothetical protein [Planctomycetia bacterium]